MKNNKIKHIKWGMLIVLLVIIFSIFIIKSQYDNRKKEQMVLLLRQNANEAKITKINDLSKIFNEFFLQNKTSAKDLCRYRLIQACHLATHSFFEREQEERERRIELDNYFKLSTLKSELIEQLSNLNISFSEEVINKAKDMSNSIEEYGYMVPEVSYFHYEMEYYETTKESDFLKEYIELVANRELKTNNPNLQSNFQILIDSMNKEVLYDEYIVEK